MTISQELLKEAGDIHIFTPLLSTITYVLNFSLKPARVTSSSALRKIRKGEDVGKSRGTMMK